MHPFVQDLDHLKDNEVELKIQELTKKYFMTINVELREQVVMVLEAYKEELGKRRAKAWAIQNETRDKGLDKLINIS